MSKVYLGYDPGGGGAHGVASIVAGRAACETVETAEDAIRWLSGRCKEHSPAALGVDTLTLWSTGPAGWRPADRALRAAYPSVANSVAAPNSLYGSMPINGAVVALELLRLHPQVKVTETHPKVLYFALAQRTYDFHSDRDGMVRALEGWIGLAPGACVVGSEHAWDALISAFAASQWDDRSWQYDLHARAAQPGERLVPLPGSVAHYAWPEEMKKRAPVERVPRGAPRGRTRDRWKAAVETLQRVGHDDVAQQVEQYRNARGERSGWDSWLKSNFPALWALIDGERAEE